MANNDIAGIVRHLDYLGCGATRKVYRLNLSTVLKVDYGNGCEYAGGCREESEAWEALRTTPVTTLLAPVLDAGDGWLTMPFATFNATDQERRELGRALGVLGIVDIGNNPGNVGRINGVVVATDYAYQQGFNPRVVAPKPDLRPMADIVRSERLALSLCVDCGHTVCVCHRQQFLPSRMVR